MRNLTAQELAALEIIRRGEDAVTGIQGTFNGEDAIFIVQVSAVEGSEELRIYPLAMLLRDEDMPFVGGPHEEHPVGPEQAGWPDQAVASKPEAWPDEGVVSPPTAGWPDQGMRPPDGGDGPPAPSAMSAIVPGPLRPPPPAFGATPRSAGPALRLDAPKPAEAMVQLGELAPYTPDGVAEEAARREEETRVSDEAARRA